MSEMDVVHLLRRRASGGVSLWTENGQFGLLLRAGKGH